MKTQLIVMVAMVAGTVVAQTDRTDAQLQAKTARRFQENLKVAKPKKCSRVEGRNVTYSGIAVAAVQAENKLQLLNPLAPEEYGNAEDSVVRDPIRHEASGLKIFSIDF